MPHPTPGLRPPFPLLSCALPNLGRVARALADTINISRLLLQTVVLGFVMVIDELVYASLAPLCVKKVLKETIAFVSVAGFLTNRTTRASRL